MGCVLLGLRKKLSTGQHCQHPLVLLAEEGDAARWAACLVKKGSELWAQRLLVSKLCPLMVCDAARLAWQGR